MVNVNTVVATVVKGATVGHHEGGTAAATAGTSRRAVTLVAPATELHKERVWGGAGHTLPAAQGGVQWPGLDGGPNFDDEIPAAEEAFQQQFGVPKSSGIEFAKYDSIDVKLEDSRADIENASGEKPSHDKLLKALAPRCKTFTDMKLGKVLSKRQ
eukprot:COSAG01_NODE_8743_length_2675_cov_0.899845_2_plen_156_part_00